MLQTFSFVYPMLSIEFLDKLNYLRRRQQAQITVQTHCYKLMEDDYINFVSLLLDEMERLELLGQTKYFAKKYFDIYLTLKPQIEIQRVPLVLITCLRLAAKFCESNEISSQLTIQFAIQQCQGQYDYDEFAACQLQIFTCFQLKMNLISPYDYFMIMDIMPKDKQITGAIGHAIDFLLSMPEIIGVGSQSIFFSALLYCCRTKKNTDVLFQTIAKATSNKWQQIQDLYNAMITKQRQIEEMQAIKSHQMEEQFNYS